MIVSENYDFVSGTRYKNPSKRLGGSIIGHLLSRVANKSFCMITRFPFIRFNNWNKNVQKDFYKKIEIKTNPVGWFLPSRYQLKRT